MTDFVTENTTPVNNSAAGSVDHKDPTKEYRIKLVKDLIGHVKRRSAFCDKFQELFGGLPGNSDTSPYRFVEDLFDDHIRIVATLIGDTVHGLDWFLFENECGDKGYEAGIDEGETREIRTVEDYLWLVDVSKDI